MTLQDPATEGWRQKLVELGFLPPDRALEAMGNFYEAAPSVDFPTWLYRQGWLAREQLQQLGVEVPRGNTTLVAASRIGTVHSGCLIEKKLGHGGMGTVYLARRQSDDAEVVVKFLAAEKLSRPSTRRRFKREAEILGKVSGLPHVVSVLAVAGDSDEPHIVMEYVRGPSLHQILEQRFSLPWAEAVAHARDVALGLAAVHELGIIHRDVKPANLLIDPAGGGIKIVDFGLAKDLEQTGITQPGQVLGTPTFMSPEQWGDVEIDGRADLFGLGATLYHLVVGEPPFEARRHQDVARKIIKGEYTPPRRIVPDLPPDLELVITMLLHTERRWRYQDAPSAAADLERVLQRQPVAVPHLQELARDQRHALVRGSKWLLGRDATCDIVLADPSVSRHHAEIQREQAGFVLRDLGSSYGSWRVPGPGGDGDGDAAAGDERIDRARLRPGDLLRLGKVELRFIAPGQAASPPSVAPEPEASDAEDEPAPRASEPETSPVVVGRASASATAPRPPDPTPAPDAPEKKDRGETTRNSPLQLLESSRGWRLRAERAVSDAVFEVLAARHDPRTALALLERLAPGPAEERIALSLGQLGLDEELGARVRTRLEERLQGARSRAQERLAKIAEAAPPDQPDLEGWLVWYDRVNGSLPPQLVPLRPRLGARLRATEGEPSESVRSIGPAAREVAIGRGEACQVRLENRAVSRLHATVLRWNDRLELRDEGSRHGVELNGRRVKLAFLDPGDVITLGKVKLACERDQAPRETQRGPLGAARVEPELFETLVELHHPAATTGLVQILHEVSRPERLEAEARRFAPADLPVESYLQQVRRAWHLRAEAARALLPRFLGAKADDAAGWRQLLAQKRSELPAQVVPWGWPGG